MKDIESASYINELSNAFDGAIAEEDDDFALKDLLSFSWQIAKGMVRKFVIAISYFKSWSS